MPVNFDPAEFGKAMGVLIRDATTPLLKRIEELEARQPERIDCAEIKSLVAEEVAKLPEPEAVEIDVFEVAAEVAKTILGGEQIKTLVSLEVGAYMQENPPTNGKDASPAQIMDAVKACWSENPPKDGKSVTVEEVTLFMEAALSKWALEFERRANDTLTKAIDKIPEPKNGKDGADFSQVDFDFDGERTITIKGKGGEIVKRLPIPLDRGYWRDGMDCEKGDIVTHDGSAWIALRDTKAKPGIENKSDWRLFARKGRDGKGGDKFPPAGPVKLGKADA